MLFLAVFPALFLAVAYGVYALLLTENSDETLEAQPVLETVEA